MLLPALGFGWARPAAAQAAAKSFWFVGTNLIFAKAQNRGGETAVASDDPGLGRFLGKLGASLSYDPGQRYVIVTSGDRRTIVFTLGDARYTVAGVTQSAPFAPYQSGGSAYLSLTALAKALYVLPVEQGGATILQPQIGDLDVRTQNSVTTVTLRSALPVKFQRVSAAGDERLVVSLNAVGTSLEPQREVSGSAALHALSLRELVMPRLAYFGVTIFAGLTRGPVQADLLHLYAAFEYHLGPIQIGELATIAAIITLPIGFLAGWLMDRFGRKLTMVPGFAGVAIAPGASMMLDALHERTAKLPRAELHIPEGPVGKNTRDAIAQGVYHGIRGMVKEIVENYATEIGSWPDVIATGGDARMLFEGWELIHAIAPDLTLYGIALAFTNHRIRHETE